GYLPHLLRGRRGMGTGARPPRSPQPAAHRLAGRWPRRFCLWTSFRIPLVALRRRGGLGPRVERQMVGLVLHRLFRTRLRLRGSVAAPSLRHQAFHHGQFASRFPRRHCFSRRPASCFIYLVVSLLDFIVIILLSTIRLSYP